MIKVTVYAETPTDHDIGLRCWSRHYEEIKIGEWSMWSVDLMSIGNELHVSIKRNKSGYSVWVRR